VQKVADSHHIDPAKAHQRQQMLVAGHEHVRPSGNRALEQPIVRRVGLHYVQGFGRGDQLRAPIDPPACIGYVLAYPVEFVA
jgi:hypothetical protein